MKFPLDSIEWHDLPLQSLAISESGIDLRITPFNESTGAHEVQRLRLMKADRFVLDIVGSSASRGIACVEVSSFDYEVREDGRLNGSIVVLEGNAGCWRIDFSGASWELTDN